MSKRELLLFAVALLAVALWLSGFLNSLTFSYLREHAEALRAETIRARWYWLGVYFLVYAAVTAVSLPGAAALTLAGGALFGFWPALAAASFASSIGATLAFLSARLLLRGWVRRRFETELSAINQGFEEEGAYYLFSLRLIPLFPFFLINIALGLTPMPALTFYWVSQVGMLPGAVLYVNAGTELGKIKELSDVASPALLFSCALIGVLPLASRRLLQRLGRQTRRR